MRILSKFGLPEKINKATSFFKKKRKTKFLPLLNYYQHFKNKTGPNISSGYIQGSIYALLASNDQTLPQQILQEK